MGANPFMDGAPAPMQAQGGPPMQNPGPGQGAPGNPFMGGGGAASPQGGAGPQDPPPRPPTPEQISQARAHLTPIVDGLMHLLGTPPGKLTKKAVFDGASTMIAKGAFPTAESKQLLIAELSKMPDDEIQIRQTLNAMLVHSASIRAQLHAVHGPG